MLASPPEQKVFRRKVMLTTALRSRRITADITFGGGVNTPGGTLNKILNIIIGLQQNTEDTIGLASGRRSNSIGNFFLKHTNHLINLIAMSQEL